jgi:uncharacterized damage-inducible protein DinB
MPARALNELLRGQGAHSDPVACVEDVSAELAGRRIDGFPHSIGQLVFHMNYWMSYELRRIRGEHPVYPEHSSESFPPATASLQYPEWDGLRERFVLLLTEFEQLAKASEQERRRQIESAHAGDLKHAGTLEAVIWQMVAHNSYHLGQIAMMRRVLGAWPPRGGGDSW